jgi:hypothetical protein
LPKFDVESTGTVGLAKRFRDHELSARDQNFSGPHRESRLVWTCPENSVTVPRFAATISVHFRPTSLGWRAMCTRPSPKVGAPASAATYTIRISEGIDTQ